MQETLLAKLIGPLWEIFKYLWAALLGLLIWKKRQDAEIRKLKAEVSEMGVKLAQTVDHEYFEEKRKEIEKKVEHDHQRIVDTMREIQSMMRDDLRNCNHSLMDEVRQIRDRLQGNSRQPGVPSGGGDVGRLPSSDRQRPCSRPRTRPVLPRP